MRKKVQKVGAVEAGKCGGTYKVGTSCAQDQALEINLPHGDLVELNWASETGLRTCKFFRRAIVDIAAMVVLHVRIISAHESRSPFEKNKPTL